MASLQPTVEPSLAVPIRKAHKFANVQGIEKLWKQVKQERLHNRFFASEKVFRKELLKALRLFQDQPSRVDGILKKWRDRALLLQNAV